MKNVLSKILDYQISSVFLEPTQLWLRVDLVSSVGEPNKIIEFYKIAYFSLSKVSSDEDGCYLIGKFEIFQLNDGGKEILTKLGHEHINEKGETNTLNKKDGFYAHIDGDICLNIIFESYKIFNEQEE